MPALDVEPLVATETATARLEKKVDALLEGINEIKVAQARLADQVQHDRRLTDQTVGFMQQAITRVEGEILDEERERIASIDGVKATLGKLAWMLFSAFLALVGAGLAAVLFRP